MTRGEHGLKSQVAILIGTKSWLCTTTGVIEVMEDLKLTYLQGLDEFLTWLAERSRRNGTFKEKRLLKVLKIFDYVPFHHIKCGSSMVVNIARPGRSGQRFHLRYTLFRHCDPDSPQVGDLLVRNFVFVPTPYQAPEILRFLR